jgi:hypothetical protein
MITITVVWLIWPGPLPDDKICIWSASLIIIFQVSVYWLLPNITHQSAFNDPTCLHLTTLSTACCWFHNTTPTVDNYQFWYSSHKFFYILITHTITPLQTQQSQVWQMWRHQCQASVTFKRKTNVNIQQYCWSITILQGFDLKHDILLVH